MWLKSPPITVDRLHWPSQPLFFGDVSCPCRLHPAPVLSLSRPGPQSCRCQSFTSNQFVHSLHTQTASHSINRSEHHLHDLSKQILPISFLVQKRTILPLISLPSLNWAAIASPSDHLSSPFFYISLLVYSFFIYDLIQLCASMGGPLTLSHYVYFFRSSPWTLHFILLNVNKLTKSEKK